MGQIGYNHKYIITLINHIGISPISVKIINLQRDSLPRHSLIGAPLKASGYERIL